MKIVQVTPQYSPHTGGVETQVQELSERLTDRGHDVVVLTVGANSGLKRSETLNGVRVRRHRSITLNGAYHVAPGIGQSVRQSDADVVHAHNIHSLPLLFAVFAATMPVVTTTYYHGASESRFRNMLWSAYRPVAEIALRRADAVSAVSNWERSMIQSDFDVEANVVPIGINQEMFAGVTPFKRDRPYLLCVARLEKYKNVQSVIRVLPKLEEFDLFIAGDGPYREELEQIADREKVANRVTFLGNVDHGELPAYYAGAEVYVSLSEFESYGITVAEALASGTPCVVQTGSALEGWVGNAGVVEVSRGDNSIDTAIRNAANQTPVCDIPRWFDVVEQYESLYERVTTE